MTLFLCSPPQLLDGFFLSNLFVIHVGMECRPARRWEMKRNIYYYPLGRGGPGCAVSNERG